MPLTAPNPVRYQHMHMHASNVYNVAPMKENIGKRKDCDTRRGYSKMKVKGRVYYTKQSANGATLWYTCDKKTMKMTRTKNPNTPAK